VRNNYYQRGFSDQISMYGKNATISGNKITRGEDMGITLHGKNNLVENNVISWQGAGGIWTTAQDTTVTTTIQNNTITKADWVNDNSTNFGAIMLFNAKGVLLLNNTMSTPALAPYGVAIRGDSGFTSDTITVTGNSALGFSTAGYGTIDTAGGTVTGITWGGGNAGTCAGNDCSGFQ
jgi:parallel beta-helix repeat protein